MWKAEIARQLSAELGEDTDHVFTGATEYYADDEETPQALSRSVPSTSHRSNTNAMNDPQTEAGSGLPNHESLLQDNDGIAGDDKA